MTPARECYAVITNDPANAAGAVGTGDGEVTLAPGVATRLAAGPSAPAGADADAQLAQARELEAKLAEEYRTVRLLRASMAGEASARGERARELGRQVRGRINTVPNIDNADAPPRASQKLSAAATLLRAMPAPSTPEARDLTHPPTGGCAGRRSCTGRRTLGARRGTGGATRRPRTHAGQGAAP
jgi:hypothetical protein